MGGRSDQPSFGGRNEEIGDEFGRALHDRVGDIPEKGRVSGELVVVPEREGHPRPGHGRDAPDAVGDAGPAEGVGQMVEGPAAGAVGLAGRHGAGDGQAADEVGQGRDGLRQIGDFGRPIVHLQVDVGVEVGIPGRLEVLVPDALEIGGKGGRAARRAHEQVAAVLEVEGGQARVSAARLDPLEPFVGRKAGGLRRAAEVEGDAVVERPVFGDMAVPELPKGEAPGPGQGLGGLGRRIGAGIEVEPGRVVIRRRRQEDGHFPRALDAERLPFPLHASALGAYDERGREAHVLAPGPAERVCLVDDAAGKDDPVPGARPDRRVPGPGQANGPRDPGAAAGRDPDGQDIVRRRSEDLPLDRDAFRRLADDRGDAVPEIEVPLVLRSRPDVLEIDEKVGRAAGRTVSEAASRAGDFSAKAEASA